MEKSIPWKTNKINFENFYMYGMCVSKLILNVPNNSYKHSNINYWQFLWHKINHGPVILSHDYDGY